MKIVFIHGRDQQGKNPSKLKDEWVAAFRKGLEKNSIVLDNSIDIRFPFYGDVLNTLVKEDSSIVVTKGGTNDDAEFYYELVNELKENAKVSDQDVVKHFEGDYIEKGPLNWPWVQAILQVLDQTVFGTASIKAFTYDVFLYLTKPGVRAAIDKIVSSSLDNEKCVVVGHSLGSIVGYNVLGTHRHHVEQYITVGSPLGLKSIKSKLSTPIAMPACIKHGWLNAYDRRDVVALNPLDSLHFNITPSIDNKGDVDNWTNNRHGIEGYLDDAEVSKTIYDACLKTKETS